MDTLIGTSDRLARTRQTIADSQNIARGVLVDLEMQREQLQDTRSMVKETSDFTSRTRELLHKIVAQSNRKKVSKMNCHSIKLIIIVILCV